MDDNIHQRILKLRDVALGSKKTVSVNSALASASYDCAVDSLLAVHAECSQSNSLSKDKNIIRFLSKHEAAVKALQKLRLTAADFDVKTVIGRGHFGEVQVVHEKSTGDVYAMKVMKKVHILQQADAAFFSEERDIMAWATSPWLTSLHYAFQDRQCLYLVMDFHPGGDLLTVMERQEGGMAEEDAKFYLAEIAMGLNDLHQLGFVHRDVKPENVLITRSGHIKLVDFGSAARLDTSGKVMESRLPVGTPEYIAPEVLTSLDCSADYGVCCDWWSLGIIAYELLFDTTPFEGDSTAQTYGNIMNYKKSLSFPDDVEVSEALRELIKKLLMDKESRLQFRGIKTHPFFSNTNWDNLTTVIPPYIPSIAGPDDTSNFEVFEPKKEDRYIDIPSRDKSGFSGKNLPFVGFTFTRYDSAQLDITDSEDGPSRQRAASGSAEMQAKAGGLQQELDGARRELQEARDRKASLERECIIYQSQLEDYHRKLEIEKSERRQSDSKALQLLAEVRDQGRVAQKLRESQATVANEEMGCVIQQLEQDRLVASKRARRLQEDLKTAQQERDAALKTVSELKGKLGEVKQSSRKDVTALQTKLAKVTKSSLAKVAEMQDRLTEAHERYAEASKKLKAAEDSRNKMEFDLQISKLHISMGDGEAKSVVKKLETLQLAKEKAEKTVSELREQLKVKGEETGSLQTQGQQLRQQLKELEGNLDEASARNQQLEASEWSLKKELQDLRSELEEVREGWDRLQASSVKTREQLHSKTQLLQKHEEAISKLSSSRQFLESKITELERLRKAADSDSVNESLKAVGQKVAKLEGEKERLSQEVSSLRARLASQKEELRGTREELSREQKSKKEAQAKHREEQRSLQSQLSEATGTAISQGERLREVRRAKRTLEQEMDTLRSSLTKAERLAKAHEQCRKSSPEKLQGLSGVNSRLAELEGEIKSLMAANSNMKNEVAATQQEREELVARRREAERSLRDTRKEVEAQELNIALLQKNLSSLEEELAEARATVQESREKEEAWQAARVALQGDLESAEARLDEAFATAEREKKARAAAEQRVSEAMVSLEKTAAAHTEEQQSLQEQFATQKQLSSKYSDKVSELEKNLKLRQLRLKGVEHELETERALSSKLYDDLHSLGREHGKLKAAHMKLLGEARQREDSLARTAADKDRVEQVHRSAAEAHQIQETRLQSTIAQQSKLIDFLQNVSSPPSKSRLKFKKAFKLTRKSRDPAKEIAEWNKLKGLASKPKGSGAVAQASTPSVSLQRITRTSSNLLTPSTTPLATPLTHQQSATQSHLLVSGPSSSRATEDFPHVTQYFSTTIPPEDDLASSLPGLKGCSVDVQRAPITAATSPKRPVAGTKRGAKRSNSDKAAAGRSSGGGAEGGAKAQRQSTTLGEMTVEHNIPHKFFLKSAPLRKSYSCVHCKTTIKAMHKLAKCSYCGIVCHPRCIDSLPNNCGLPSQLADHVFSQLPATKKPRREAEPGGEETPMSGEHTAEMVDGSREEESRTARNWEAVRVKQEEPKRQEAATKKGKGLHPKASGDSSSSGPSGSGSDSEERTRTDSLLKVEKVHIPKGQLKVEGWLVLTNKSLCFYNRDPRRATRKPLNSFVFNSPDCAFVFLPMVEKRYIPYSSPSKTLTLAFGVKQHTSSGEEQAVFITSSLQSKIEWVEAIQKVISQCSQQPPPQTPQVAKMQPRELKSVSLVPVRTPQQLGTSLNKSGDAENLELSITSDMFDSPSSLI